MTSKEYMGLTIFYREGSSDDAVLNHSFTKDIFYPAISDFNVQSNMTIIDVGAHIGTFSLLSSIKFNDAVVYAFEPNQDSFQILKKNIEQNSMARIESINKAVTDKSGKIILYLDNQNWGHSTAHKVGDREELVDSINLSDFFTTQKIKKCDLIKFNCEGAEFKILYSLRASDLKKIAMLLVLYHEDLSDGFANGIRGLYKFLSEHGFYGRIVNKSGKRGWLIAKNKLYYKISISNFSNVKNVLKDAWTFLKFI